MMDEYSLFLGRFQPPHDGHKAIILRLIDEGRTPVIGIRDTKPSRYNPFTVDERIEKFYVLLGTEAMDKCWIVRLPDIDDVVYGRTPGWNIREIDVDAPVSATEKRKELMGDILWLTGNSGAGKTTLANELQSRIPNSVVLDGDEMRGSISLGAGFDMDERQAHNETVARLASVMAARGHTVIVALIAPSNQIRQAVHKICAPQWVFVYRTMVERMDYPYDPPMFPDVLVDHDLMSPDQAADHIFEELWTPSS
jgi:adenylylsulfate kinase